ncbi:MAG: zinc-ribbon domain-containing protein [Deltaproteobacteria bacterium]|nr:zinc-ribbon domain-containing protein [Deltaproteobacteria bacterium]
MEIICTGCNTKLNIPDERLPKDQVVRINCPKCKTRLTIEPQGAWEEAFDKDDMNQESENERIQFLNSREKMKKSSPIIEEQEDDYTIEYYEDVKLALVMADENLNRIIKPAVEEQKYKFITAPSIREALLKLRYHHFDLIILSDGFDGQEIYGGPIMNYLNHLSMTGRRRIFVALISEKYKTMDEMMAYSLSANMVVSTREIGSLSILLKRGLQEYEQFYKVFTDILQEEGKG